MDKIQVPHTSTNKYTTPYSDLNFSSLLHNPSAEAPALTSAPSSPAAHTSDILLESSATQTTLPLASSKSPLFYNKHTLLLSILRLSSMYDLTLRQTPRQPASQTP